MNATKSSNNDQSHCNLREAEILDRYRANYGFLSHATLDPEKVFAHWSLEKELTGRLLNSTRTDRHHVAVTAYTELYESLRWHDDVPKAPQQPGRYRAWELAVGDAPKDVYEIGSGQGDILRALAAVGHRCCGTEITEERGKRYDEQSELKWATTDGVHLDQYEPAGSYDVLLSNQVVEHLHPDDLHEHFRSAATLLRPGGRYVFSTPHWLTGPHDVSAIFGCLYPEGMHLREYSWGELTVAMRKAGFTRVFAATTLRLQPLLSKVRLDKPLVHRQLGTAYLWAMRMIETGLRLNPHRRSERAISLWLRRRGIFSDNIFLIGQTATK